MCTFTHVQAEVDGLGLEGRRYSQSRCDQNLKIRHTHLVVGAGLGSVLCLLLG